MAISSTSSGSTGGSTPPSSSSSTSSSSKPASSGPTGSPSPSSSSGATGPSGAPKPASTASSTGSGPPPSSVSSSSGSTTTAEPNLAADAERFEANPSALASGEGTVSDPESSAEFAGVQGEAALDVTGEPVEEEEAPAEIPPEVAEYDAIMTQIENLRQTGQLSPGFMSPEQELATLETRLVMIDGGAGRTDLDNALAAVDTSFEALQHQADLNATFRGTTGTFLTEEEGARFEQFAQERLNEQAPAFEEASANLFEQLRDPMTQAVVDHMNVGETQAFLEDVTRYGAYSSQGLEFVGNLQDDLATIAAGGQPESRYAQALLDTRAQLSGDGLAAFDRNLGVLTGIDQAVRPEGATERLESIGEVMGLSPEQVAAIRQPAASPAAGASTGELVSGFNDFVGSANTSFGIFDGIVDKVTNNPLEVGGDTLGAVETGAQRLLSVLPRLDDLGVPVRGASNLLDVVGKFAGRAGPLLEAGGIVVDLAQGDYLGAGGGALGLVGGAIVGSSPGLGWTMLAASGGIAAYKAMEGQIEYANFRTDAISHAVGDFQTNPVAAALMGANAGNISLLPNLAPEGAPRRAQLEALMAQSMPGADAGTVFSMFWDTQLANRLVTQ